MKCIKQNQVTFLFQITLGTSIMNDNSIVDKYLISNLYLSFVVTSEEYKKEQLVIIIVYCVQMK